ncbi:crotonase/enoyl-CoA hydratase family protein [Dichotomicrobium thermohalophilum]|uniref:DSF synthase n=1 Tax=Dichotomicrobium thermohalophilum TaxID=933063 RepID=A0A397PBT3_9HYPH|nr:crotonase/enoyl-CoA hydratase family protein [Dichotomicrobium thermohalophilum]RIA45389.1 DSF synthase [Dichotomicrobium thermohalophilum]
MRLPIHLVQGEPARASSIRFDTEAFARSGGRNGQDPVPQPQMPAFEADQTEPSEAQRAAAARLASRLQALDLRELELEYDPATRAVWGFQTHRERPSYTPQMLRDIQAVQRALRTFYRESPRDAALAARFTVLASRTPGVFNLGGDLQFFVSCVEAGDEQALREYAMASIDICYRNYHACEAGMVTTALVCGDALGGGFEAAMACDVIVAEEQARFALPEISYGLFPGMGAYTFLSRRLGQARAERAILDSPVLSAQQLYDLELVNAIAPDGEGVAAMDRQLAWMAERFEAVFNVFEARRIAHPVSRTEMEEIGERWVRLALRLPEARLRKMAKLAQAQRLRMRRRGSA